MTTALCRLSILPVFIEDSGTVAAGRNYLRHLKPVFMKTYPLACLLLCCAAISLHGQGFFQNTSIRFGFATPPPDTRKDGLRGRLIESLAADEFNNDKEYAFYLTKKVIDSKFLEVDVGLGYALRSSSYSPWVDNPNMHNRYTLDFVGRYLKHKAIAPVEAGLKLPLKFRGVVRGPASPARLYDLQMDS